jgi:very-short-patch-repair endonuclease
MVSVAQRLRKNPTPAEVRFWRLMEPLRLGGVHFRKQVRMGPFVVDFACHAARLVIEIDGDSHFSEAGLARDRVRDAALAARGYRVLRFTNSEVMGHGEGVFEVVRAALRETDSSVLAAADPLPGPPLKGEGEIGG